MKPKRTLSSLLLLVALSALGVRTLAQEFSAGNLARRTVERRAVEAVIWGMPAVNTDLMLQEMLRNTTGKANEVLYWSRPADFNNQTLTPNPDCIYFMTFYNTKEVGPVVVEIPPADTESFAGSIVNVWQMPLDDVGPEGADRGKGGKYLILPPGYTGNAPEGYIVLRSDTFTGYGLLRSNLLSHRDADVAKAVAYGKRVKIYPLSKADNPGETPFSDASGVLFDSTIRYDLSFFQSLDRIVQMEPWLQRDRAMIDPLKSIGIEKGRPFQPDANAQAILNGAVREAQAWLDQRYDAGFPQYNPPMHWTLPTYPEMIEAYQTSYGNPNAYPVDARGVSYTYAFIGIKNLGAAQFYQIAIKDKEGNAFEGARTYRLTVPANAPVKQYWSVTAYDREKHTLIRNVPWGSRSSQLPELQKNADGSVDIYFGPKAPEGKETNWVPTDANRNFELMFRLYGPEKALFERTWKLPDVEKVSFK